LNITDSSHQLLDTLHPSEKQYVVAFDTFGRRRRDLLSLLLHVGCEVGEGRSESVRRRRCGC